VSANGIRIADHPLAGANDVSRCRLRFHATNDTRFPLADEFGITGETKKSASNCSPRRKE
jgi:hypothetical protein